MGATRFPEKLDEWIVRFVSGELSSEEEACLNAWRKSDKANELLFQQLTAEENWKAGISEIANYNTGEAWMRLGKKVSRRKYMRLRNRWMGIAAVVTVIFGSSLLLFRFPEGQRPVVCNGGEVAGVRISRSSGEIYRLDTLWKLSLPNSVMESGSGQLVITSIAAMDVGQEPEISTVEVPRGAEYSLVLADGTKVLLNAETSFCFPETFNGKSIREVYLTGEAYFEVAADSRHPFIVHTERGYVKVLGTSFNVTAYKNMPLLQTTLVKGHVRIGDKLTGKELDLQPGMRGVLDKMTGEMSKQDVDVSYCIAWKDGIFAFREQRLEEVIETLSRWYGFEYFFRNAEMRDYVYTGKVVRHGDLKKVLDSFRMTEELDFLVNGNTVIIQNKN